METLCAAEFTPLAHLSFHYNPVHPIEDIWNYGSCFFLFWQEENICQLYTLKCHHKSI